MKESTGQEPKKEETKIEIDQLLDSKSKEIFLYVNDLLKKFKTKRKTLKVLLLFAILGLIAGNALFFHMAPVILPTIITTISVLWSIIDNNLCKYTKDDIYFETYEINNLYQNIDDNFENEKTNDQKLEKAVDVYDKALHNQALASIEKNAAEVSLIKETSFRDTTIFRGAILSLFLAGATHSFLFMIPILISIIQNMDKQYLEKATIRIQ